MVQRGHIGLGAFSTNLEGPDSLMVVHAVARVLRSRFVTGMMPDLRVEEILALISAVLGRLGDSFGSPPR